VELAGIRVVLVEICLSATLIAFFLGLEVWLTLSALVWLIKFGAE